jgi:hypothetical protein
MVGRFQAHTLPDGSTVYFEPKKHAYYGELKESARSEGGYSYVQSSRLPGISTVAKHLDGSVEGLLYWAVKLEQIGIAKLAVQALDEGRDMTWVLEQRTIRDALAEAGLAWTDIRDEAAARGDLAHELQVAIFTGGKPTLAAFPDDQRGYGQALFKWVRDRAPRPKMVEQVTADVATGVAGTFDLMAEVDSDRFESLPFDVDGPFTILTDAKSRESGKDRRSDHIQLAGYERSNRACEIGATDHRLVLLLLPDGEYKEKWCVGTDADFAAALVAHKQGKSLERRMNKPAEFYAERPDFLKIDSSKDGSKVEVSAA